MIAFGYVRHDGANEAAVEAAVGESHELIVKSGADKGYDVDDVYVDRQTPPGDIARPGFQALVEAELK